MTVTAAAAGVQILHRHTTSATPRIQLRWMRGAPNKLKIKPKYGLIYKRCHAELDAEFQKALFRLSSHLRHQGNIAAAYGILMQ